MKYIRLFETVNKIKIGDYIILNGSNASKSDWYNIYGEVIGFESESRMVCKFKIMNKISLEELRNLKGLKVVMIGNNLKIASAHITYINVYEPEEFNKLTDEIEMQNVAKKYNL